MNTVQLSDVLLKLEGDRLLSDVFGEDGLSGVGCPSGVLLKLEARWKEAQPTAAGELMRNRCLFFFRNSCNTGDLLGIFSAVGVEADKVRWLASLDICIGFVVILCQCSTETGASVEL